MTFSDFGLNIECNAFQNVTKIIGNGAEWAVKHMPENSVVFVVDEFGSTICFVRTTGKAQLTDTYINAEGDADYKLIGAWINEYLEEHDFQKVGIIVETSSDIHQVVTNNSNTRKENFMVKEEKGCIVSNEGLESISVDWLNNHRITFEELEKKLNGALTSVIIPNYAKLETVMFQYRKEDDETVLLGEDGNCGYVKIFEDEVLIDTGNSEIWVFNADYTRKYVEIVIEGRTHEFG